MPPGEDDLEALSLIQTEPVCGIWRRALRYEWHV